MAGCTRFEVTSTSSDPGFANGQRGSHSGPQLDRSGSFREGVESRMLGSGVGTCRGSGALAGDLPTLSHSLMLEPIVLGDQMYTRSGELRMVMGCSVGSTLEDNSFGAAHIKPSPPMAMEELKRLRSSVADTCTKARGRVKKLDDHLSKLNKYCEAVTSKKPQRNEALGNERPSGLNLKMGTQTHRNPQDLVSQKLEDRPKTSLLNKRVRTAVAEARSECRSNGPPRQPLVIAKERDLPKDNDADPDLGEEKVGRLPGGGESWERKMKRRRSAGTVVTRAVDGDGESKRAMHHKLSNGPILQSFDGQNFRSGASNGSGAINKLDGASLPSSSSARATLKNEQERTVLPRDLAAGLDKERLLAKGSNKLNKHEESYAICPGPVTKGKASRAPRTGSAVASNLSPKVPCVSGTLESWEHLPTVIKAPSVVGATNCRRAMPSGSSSPPITQWGGQRPQKISRTRRANLVSPVSNHDEIPISSDGCLPSEVGTRLASNGNSGSLFSRSATNGTKQFNVKLENIHSPARLSESEESGGGEIRLKEKGMCRGEVQEKAVNAVQNGLSATLTKKDKFTKEDVGDGVRRQGRSGRGPSYSRASPSPTREKLDSAAETKPVRSVRPGSEKSGSKFGRPSKKLSDRKGFSRLGNMQNGQSDDDREELLAAANFARNASNLACSSSFWKNMEPIFASVGLEEKSYLAKQLKQAEEFHESLPRGSGCGNMGNLAHEEISVSANLVSEEGDRQPHYQIGLEESVCVVQLTDQHQEADGLFGKLDPVRRSNKIIPLYERVLSALILEDEIEESEENIIGENISVQNTTCAPSYDPHFLVDAKPGERDGMDFECDLLFGVQTQRHGAPKRIFSCNGSTKFVRSPSIENPLANDELLREASGFAHSEVLDGPQTVHLKDLRISSFDCQYEQMSIDGKLLLELQSIGLYPETVPDLDDGEDDLINQEIVQLKRKLSQQVGNKKMCLGRIYKATGSKVEGCRGLEEVAMDRLVELAYRKILATRGVSKGGVTKVSKQVALAFARRTLARCRKYEDSGKSCFSEPALRDVIYSGPLPDKAPLTYVGQAVALESRNPQPDPRVSSGAFLSNRHGGPSDAFETFTHLSDEAFAKSGPISNRGKKKEVLLDDVVGNSVLRAASSLGNTLLGGTKTKKGEREREKDTPIRSSVAKSGRPSQGNFKGERKAKSKPKQKTAQLSTSGNGIVSRLTETIHPIFGSASDSNELVNNSGNKRRETKVISLGNGPQETSNESKESMDFTNLPLNDIDPIDDLGASTDLSGHQDLGSLFNFEDEGLQDHFSVGLEIPMDDLSGVF